MSRVFAECQEAGLPEVAWFCLSENASVPWQISADGWVGWDAAAVATEAMSFYGGLGFTPSAATAPQRQVSCDLSSQAEKSLARPGQQGMELLGDVWHDILRKRRRVAGTDRCDATGQTWSNLFCSHASMWYHVFTMPTAALFATFFSFLPNGNALRYAWFTCPGVAKDVWLLLQASPLSPLKAIFSFWRLKLKCIETCTAAASGHPHQL